MKKLPVLLCIFLLSACDVPLDNLVQRNGIRQEINSQTPFTGVATEYYENGQLKSKVTYKDGEEQGLFESYRENGQLEYKNNYKDGEVNGLFETYHENGQLKDNITFKDGEVNGLYEAYKENGQEENYSPDCYQNGNQVDMSKCKQP